MNNSIINQLDIVAFAKKSNVIDIDLFDEKKYGAIQVYETENHPALFLKEVDSFDFTTIKQIAEIHKICWNFQKVLFLYVYTKTEIRIYNCSEKPFSFDGETKENEFVNKLEDIELYSCKETDKEKLKLLNTIFSRLAIDTGFIWSSDKAVEIRKKIKLQNRVDKFLIQSLINVSKELEAQGLNDKNLIHKLVMRSLFLLYLEDRGATKKEFYSEFSIEAESYLDLLKEGEVNNVYSLFKKLAEDFNGSLFNIEENEKELVTDKHLDLIRQCFTNGYTNSNQTKLFSDWKLFDFSIIRIELLSEIYENFLSELDKKEKKNTGTFYTPPSLVELILNEKLPVYNNESEYNLKTLDPSCGSGIFLVQSFKRLVKRYENKHHSKLNDFNVLVDILKTNIYGIELDPKSIKVTAFSLYLALLDNLDPKTGWWNKTIQFPYLINDSEDATLKQQGKNLFRRDTISDLSEIKELQDFDLIVGNPPFGELLSEERDVERIQKNIRLYCDKNKFPKEMVIPFLHKSVMLAPKGKIALIFNTKVLTNTGGTYQKFREWLFSNYVEKIYNFSILRNISEEFGGQLFGSAVGPISIVFYQNETPIAPKDTITYCAPKTYIKNDILEGIVIDSSDEKHLPRTECEKKDSKIWKIAMWGSYFDFKLIEKIDKNYINLNKSFKEKNIEFKTGLNGDIQKQDFIPNLIVKTNNISKYYTRKDAVKPNNKYYRNIDSELFIPPYIAIKKGQKDKLITASLITHNAYCMSGAYIINNTSDNEKKAILALINSRFSTYFLFLISSSWGIEREQIMSNEFLYLPYLFDEKTTTKLLSSKIDEIISIKKIEEENGLKMDVSTLEKEIDQIIYNDILKLTVDEQIIIQDTLDFSLDLFEKQEKSKAVLPVNTIDIYSERIIKELNDWLDDVDLKVSATHYRIDRNCPLYMIKLSFGNQEKEAEISKEDIYSELKILDQKLWNEEAKNLYFRKKINYFDGNDVYIIKPNQRRFWSQTVAMEDSKSLLVEILNMKE
jgi:type I restriction-modification system DNA methylase subunit